MPLFLVGSSHKVYFETIVEADNEDAARIKIMKQDRKLMTVAYSGFGVDSVEEFTENEKDWTPFIKRLMQ